MHALPLRHFICPAVILMTFATGLATQDPLHDGLPTGTASIHQDRDGHIWLAVDGAQGGLVLRGDADDPDRFLTVARGRVSGLQIDPVGDAWLAVDDEILRHPRDGSDPVARTASFAPSAAPGRLLATRWGDVWCDGCARRRLGNAQFEAVPAAPAGWTVTPVGDDPFGNVWGVATDGTQRDLAVLSRAQPHLWKRLDLPPALRPGGIAAQTRTVTVDDAGFVWVVLDDGLLRADPRSATGHRLVEHPGSAAVTAVTRVGGGQIAAGSDDGAIRQVSVKGDEAPVWHTVRDGGAERDPVQAMLHDREGRLWVLGGGRLERISGLEAEWHAHWNEQPPMPAGNHDHVFARIGDRLYTAGGKTFFGWPADEWVNLDHVWSYDIPTGTWRVEPPMLEPGKAYSGIAALDGELWLIGGLFRHGNGTRGTSTVEIHDPETGRYRVGPALPRKAGQVVALTVAGRIYAVGGADGEGPATAEVLSIGSGETTWRVEASAPGPVSQASGCVLDDVIYIAAGPGSQCPGLFVYDPGQASWSQIEHPGEQAPSAPLCAAFGGSVWVLGGRGKGGGQTLSYAYTPATGQWRRGPDIPLPVSWAAAADADGRLLIAGGAYEEERVGNFYNTDRVFFLREEWPRAAD